MNIYQFKITLCYIKPEVWRIFQVPESFNFFDLHLAIQVIMGWEDRYHFDFTLGDFSIGEGEMSANAEKVDLKDVLEEGDKINYIYDFGDRWTHLLELVKVHEVQTNNTFPVCLDGACKCPPEDIGGPLGYAEMLNALKNKEHPARKEYLKKLGNNEAYDQMYFDKTQVNKKLLNM